MKQTSIDPARNELIRVRAYEIWCGRGCPNGTAEQDWIEAERAVSALLAAQAVRDRDSDSDGAASAQQDPPAVAHRAERSDRLEAIRIASPAPVQAKSSVATRAAGNGETKPHQAPPHASPEPKTQQAPAPAATAPAAQSAPLPPVREAEPKAAPAKTRGRARAQHPPAASTRQTATASAADPASAARTSSRSGTRRATGTPTPARQRKG
jgi:hypothetical protein